MKKIIYSALIFALLAALVSCKSTKGAGKSAEPKKNNQQNLKRIL